MAHRPLTGAGLVLVWTPCRRVLPTVRAIQGDQRQKWRRDSAEVGSPSSHGVVYRTSGTPWRVTRTRETPSSVRVSGRSGQGQLARAGRRLSQLAADVVTPAQHLVAHLVTP